MSKAPDIPFALTTEQIRFFHLFGYLKLPGLFKTEITEISQRFDEQFERRADEIIFLKNEAHYYRTRKVLLNFIDSDPELSALLGDDRIYGIAHGLAGDDFNFVSSDGNIFSENTVWHADNYLLPRGLFFFKIALYLDPMTAESGAFRVIPGSHHEGSPYSRRLHEVMPQHQEKLGLNAEQIPCQILESHPGDVIVFNYRLHHATCHAKQRRRMFHFGISTRATDEKIPGLVNMWRSVIKQQGPIYGSALRQQKNPKIQRHLQQLLSLLENPDTSSDH